MPRRSKQPTVNDMLADLAAQLKTSAERPNIYGYDPHQKQLEFHSSPARGRLFLGGNRSGKTTAGVVDDIWTVTKKHPYRRVIQNRPVQGRVVGVDFINGIQKILLPEFARWLPPSELTNGSWEDSYSKGERKLQLANGSFIEFMSYDQDLDKFAGTSRDFIHYDEEPPEDIFKECSARLIDVAGDWHMTMTPVDGMTWIYDKLYLTGKNNPEARISVFEVEMAQNPHISQQEVEAYAATLDPDERAARTRGQFVQRGGLVYKKFKEETHVVNPVIPPKEWEWYVSIDHGYNNPTAVLWHAVSPSGNVVTFGEHYESERTIDYHATVIHTRNAVYGRIPDYYVGDPAMAQHSGITGTSVQSEYIDSGIPLVFGNNDVKPGINRINQYLEIDTDGKPQWVLTRDCLNLIREIQRLRWKTFASKKTASANNKSDLIHKKDDHACDSARYFFSFLPDLRPYNDGDMAPARKLDRTVKSVGIDHFVPQYAEISSSKGITTEWHMEGIDEYMGGIA